MTFYAQHHQQESKAIKDFINKDIVRNMIEIINMQILFKLISYQFTQGRQADSTSQEMRFKDMSPIDLRIFKQLIPQSYTQEMESKLTKINDEIINEEKGDEAALAGAITDGRALIPQGDIVVDQVDESNSQNSKRLAEN